MNSLHSLPPPLVLQRYSRVAISPGSLLHQARLACRPASHSAKIADVVVGISWRLTPALRPHRRASHGCHGVVVSGKRPACQGLLPLARHTVDLQIPWRQRPRRQMPLTLEDIQGDSDRLSRKIGPHGNLLRAVNARFGSVQNTKKLSSPNETEYHDSRKRITCGGQEVNP